MMRSVTHLYISVWPFDVGVFVHVFSNGFVIASSFLPFCGQLDKKTKCVVLFIPDASMKTTENLLSTSSWSVYCLQCWMMSCFVSTVWPFFVICELTCGRVSSLVFEELVQSRWSLVRAPVGPAGGEPEGEGLDHLSHTFLWTGWATQIYCPS